VVIGDDHGPAWREEIARAGGGGFTVADDVRAQAMSGAG
jgi:hypothetical protein